VLCHDHGGIVEDGIIVRFSAERLWWIGGPGFAEQAIHGAAIGRDVTVTGHLDTWHTASLQGPASRDLLQPVTEADLSRLGWYGVAETRICGVPVVLLRAGYTAELGYDILVRSEDGAGFFAALWDAVRPGGARLAGSRSLGIRRVEASILNFGQDFDWTHNPYEIGLDWMVAPDKPGFVAADALRRVAAEGPRHRLIGLHLDGRTEAEVGDPVLVDGRAVGIVTSPLLSPTLERSIAMAMVEAPAAGATSGIAVRRDDETIGAAIVAMPFFDPERKLAKS
jgi:aminomethyltransferase